MKSFLLPCLLFIGSMVLPQILLIFGVGFWTAFFDIHFLLAIIGIPAGIISNATRALFKKSKDVAFKNAMAYLITGVLFVPAFFLTLEARSYAFYLAGLRAEKVIVAVEQYQERNKTLPDDLKELIPDYLAKIPYGVPPMRIEIDKNDPSRWSLIAYVGTGVLNWDMFVYVSNHDYSSFVDSPEKLGKWVYYHE